MIINLSYCGGYDEAGAPLPGYDKAGLYMQSENKGEDKILNGIIEELEKKGLLPLGLRVVFPAEFSDRNIKGLFKKTDLLNYMMIRLPLGPTPDRKDTK